MINVGGQVEILKHRPEIWKGEPHESHIEMYRLIESPVTSIHKLSLMGIEAKKIYNGSSFKILYNPPEQKHATFLQSDQQCKWPPGNECNP